MMSKRPYFSLSTSEIEDLYQKHPEDHKILELIKAELGHRKRPRAQKLLARIEDALSSKKLTAAKDQPKRSQDKAIQNNTSRARSGPAKTGAEPANKTTPPEKKRTSRAPASKKEATQTVKNSLVPPTLLPTGSQNTISNAVTEIEPIKPVAIEVNGYSEQANQISDRITLDKAEAPEPINPTQVFIGIEYEPEKRRISRIDLTKKPKKARPFLARLIDFLT